MCEEKFSASFIPPLYIKYNFIMVLKSNYLNNLFIAVVHESLSLVVSRQILTELCNHIPNMDASPAKEISHFILDKLQPRAISFEEQVCAVEIHQFSFPHVKEYHKLSLLIA